MISTRDASVKWVQVTSCHASLRHQPVHPSASLIHQHAMAGAHGSRSRDGCSNCRRRKRRCDESKPVCLTCRRTGADCIYPVPDPPPILSSSSWPPRRTISFPRLERERAGSCIFRRPRCPPFVCPARRRSTSRMAQDWTWASPAKSPFFRARGNELFARLSRR